MLGAHLQEWLRMAAALSLLLIVSYVHFRHIGLALVAVLAPLPGGILAVWLGVQEPWLPYFCGFFIAIVLASLLSLRVCEGDTIKDAVWNAWMDGRGLLTGIGAFVLVMAALPFVLTRNTDGAAMVGAILLCCVGAAAVLPCARLLPFGPEFVTRANRVRENQERWLNRLSFVVQPRWGWSISGIALTIAVLGFFGANDFGVARPLGFSVLAGEAIVLLAMAFLATRDTRRTLAFGLASAVLYGLSLWIGHRLNASAISWPFLSLSAMPALAMAIGASGFAREGDNAAVALLRALEMLSAAVAFFCAGAAMAALALGAVAGCLLVIFGTGAGLVLLPALTTAIYDLFPPRASLDAYRIR